MKTAEEIAEQIENKLIRYSTEESDEYYAWAQGIRDGIDGAMQIAASHPPAAPVKLDKTGEYYPGLEHQRLFNAIEQTKGLPLVSEMQDIIKIVHEDFPAAPVSGEELTEEIIQLKEPWPLKDIIGKLVEASEILLNNKNYDGHGWEEISHATKMGKDVIKKLEKLSATLPTREQGRGEVNDIAEVEFDRCSNCDGHDACEDFGCAIMLGLQFKSDI